MNIILPVLLVGFSSANVSPVDFQSVNDVVEKEFEKAVISMASPTLDISLLTAAPQAALMLNSLSVIASSTIDASLVNKRTEGAIRLLKTPRSFRASLYQIGQGISDAFRTAHRSMLAIEINLDDVPAVMTSMITAYAKPEDSGSKFLMNLQMRNFVDIVKICTEESKQAARAFNETLELIRELVQVTTATAGDNEEQVGEAKKLLKEFDEHKRFLDGEKERLQREIERQRDALDAALVKHDEAVNDIVNRDLFDRIAIGVQSYLGSDTDASDGDALNSAMSVYFREKEVLQVLQQQDTANRQAIADIAAKIAKSNVDLLNFEEVVYYLSRGVKILGQIQEQWTRLQNFFESMQTVIVGPITRNLLTFDEVVKAKELKDSGSLRNQLIISGFKSASLCISVARAANIYNAISKEFVLPLVDGSTSKLTLSKEESRVELGHLSHKMHDITETSHIFLEEKIRGAEEMAKEQIAKCRDEFKAALGTSNP